MINYLLEKYYRAKTNLVGAKNILLQVYLDWASNDTASNNARTMST
jgi:hypothetical protein